MVSSLRGFQIKVFVWCRIWKVGKGRCLASGGDWNGGIDTALLTPQSHYSQNKQPDQDRHRHGRIIEVGRQHRAHSGGVHSCSAIKIADTEPGSR